MAHRDRRRGPPPQLTHQRPACLRSRSSSRAGVSVIVARYSAPLAAMAAALSMKTGTHEPERRRRKNATGGSNTLKSCPLALAAVSGGSGPGTKAQGEKGRTERRERSTVWPAELVDIRKVARGAALVREAKREHHRRRLRRRLRKHVADVTG